MHCTEILGTSILDAGERPVKPDKLTEQVLACSFYPLKYFLCLFLYFLVRLGKYVPLALHFVIYYQPLSPKDERIVSANPSPNAVIVGPSRDVTEQQESTEAVGDLNTVHPLNAYVSHEQNVSYGG